MFQSLGSNIVNELIIKNYLELPDLLKLRRTCKILHTFTDINDKDNNEFLWKFYYLKNQLHNYRILPDSKFICNPNKEENRGSYYDWYRKIYYPCSYGYINKIKKGEDITIDEVYNIIFNDKDIYLKELFKDCCNKLSNVSQEFIFCWKNIYEFWKEIGSPSIHLHHYDLSTCGFECNKKPINYKCFFKELAKRTKTKYKKFLSAACNDETLCDNRIFNKKARLLQLEIEEEEKLLKKIKDTKINSENLKKYLETAVKPKKKSYLK
jgi:hypothetical protein